MELHIRAKFASKYTPQHLVDELDGAGFPHSSPPPPAPKYNIAKDRIRRQVIPPKRYVKADLVAYVLNVEEGTDCCEEPSNYDEVMSSDDSSTWVVAMHEEMESLHKNGTQDLMKLPNQKKAFRCKWIFEKNEGIPSVEKSRYKARPVAKGYSHIPSIDFTYVHSPIIKQGSIITLLSIVAFHDLYKVLLELYLISQM